MSSALAKMSTTLLAVLPLFSLVASQLSPPAVDHVVCNTTSSSPNVANCRQAQSMLEATGCFEFGNTPQGTVCHPVQGYLDCTITVCTRNVYGVFSIPYAAIRESVDNMYNQKCAEDGHIGGELPGASPLARRYFWAHQQVSSLLTWTCSPPVLQGIGFGRIWQRSISDFS